MATTNEVRVSRPAGLRFNPWVIAHSWRIETSLRAVVAAAVVLVVARQVRLDIGPLPALVALLPWVAVVCVIVAFAAWRVRMPVPAIAGALVAAEIAALWVPALTVESESAAEPGAPHLRVMAFNSAANPTAIAAAAKLAQQRDVDMLLIVEAVPAIHDQMPDAALRSVFSYSYLDPSDQVGIWSREPLRDVTSLPMEFGGKSVHVNVGGEDVTIVAAHTQSPRYARATQWRSDQRTLRALVDEKRSGPILLAGDLNMTRDHGWYRDYLRDGFIDAADAAGKGWMGTWSYGADNFPLVTIDHLLGRGLHLSSYDTIRVHGSDHLAVVADIQPATH